jgi:hypothetical protein
VGEETRMFSRPPLVEFRASRYASVLSGVGLHEYQDAVLVHKIS